LEGREERGRAKQIEGDAIKRGECKKNKQESRRERVGEQRPTL
jgi:hypothetical protein